MIDLHIHILPGIDDGPADPAGTIELARACIAEGITEVTATPHVNETHFTTPEQMRAGVEAARASVKDAGLELKIHGGAEIAIDQLVNLSDDDLRALTLGPTDAYILLETPYAAWPMELEQHIGRLAELGIRGVLAHPERSAGVQAPGGMEKLEFAVGRGVYVQVTAGSLAGRFGRTAKGAARELLQRELIHFVSSDAHSADRRPPRMREAAEAIESAELAQWLTTDAPAAVLAGERLPPRPALPERKRFSLRRNRPNMG